MLFEKVKKPAPTNLSVKAKASFNAIAYSKVSDDQFVEFIVNRYTTLANANANTLAVEVYRGPNVRYHDVNSDGGMVQDGDYWYRHLYVDVYGNESNLSAAVTAKYSGQKFSDMVGQLVEAQLADAQLTTAKFAAGIKPVEILSSLPSTGNTAGRVVFLTTDSKLYRYDGSAWVASTAAADIAGQISDTQLAAISAAKITGTLVANQIADAQLTAAKFASSIKPVEIVSTLPTTGNTAGRVVFLTTDNKLYRYNGTAFVSTTAAADVTGTLTDAQIAALSAAKLTGQITSTQITDSAITTPKISTGAVTANEIAATTITGAKIAATTIAAGNIIGGTITATQIAADTLTAGQIAAGAISSSELAANSVIAGKIAAGTITANEIAATTITGAKIAATTIAAGNLVAGTITANEIAGTTITGAKIAANTITGSNIAANTIVAGNIAAGAISATELAAGAVTATKISVANLAAISATLGNVDISNATIGTLTVGTINIAAGAVTDDKTDQSAPTAPAAPSISPFPADIDKDGTLDTAITITWVPPSTGRAPKKYFVEVFRKRGDKGTDGNNVIGYTFCDSFTVPAYVLSKPLKGNANYFYKARVTPLSANDVAGTPSAYTTTGIAPQLVAADPTPPSGLQVQTMFGAHVIFWDAPVDPDYSYTILYSNLGIGSTIFTLTRSSAGMIINAGQYAPLANNPKYWVAHVNRQGKISTMYPNNTTGVGGGNGNTGFVDADAIKRNAVTTSEIANGTILPVNMATSAITAKYQVQTTPTITLTTTPQEVIADTVTYLGGDFEWLVVEFQCYVGGNPSGAGITFEIRQGSTSLYTFQAVKSVSDMVSMKRAFSAGSLTSNTNIHIFGSVSAGTVPVSDRQQICMVYKR